MKLPVLDWKVGLALLSLVLAALLVYFPGVDGDFIFDDFPNLLENRRLYLQSLDLNSLASAAMSSDAGILKRPVSMLTFAVNLYAFGPTPLSFKVVNVLIHALNALLVYWLVLLLVRELGRGAVADSFRNERLAALAAAAIWLLHPLQLTSVLYVVQRMTSLSALFTLAALIVYCQLRSAAVRGKPLSIPRLLLGIALAAGSVFSKETGVLLPVYAFVIELVVYRFRKQDGRLSSGTVALFLTTLALPALVAALWLATHFDWLLNLYATRNFDLDERLLTESRVLLFYLRLVFLPSVSALGIYHDDIPLSTGLLTPLTTLWAIAFILLLLVAAILVIRKLPVVAFAILWFFGGHTLESTLLPLELAHEHRNYLPLLGPALMIGWWFAGLIGRPKGAQIAVVGRIAVATWILLLAVITTVRAGQWQDNVTQAVTEAHNHPASPRAVYSAGRIYANLVLTGNPQYWDAAVMYLQSAADLDPHGILGEASLVLLHAHEQRPIDPSWLDRMAGKLKTSPASYSNVMSLYELVKCLGSDCKIAAKNIEDIFGSALGNPELAKMPQIHAEVLTAYGSYTSNILGDYRKTATLFRKAADINPGQPQHRANLFNVLVALGDTQSAEIELAVLRKLPPWQVSPAALAAMESDLNKARTKKLRK